MYRQGRPEKTRMIRWRMVSCSNAMQDTSCEICMEEKHRLTEQYVHRHSVFLFHANLTNGVLHGI